MRELHNILKLIEEKKKQGEHRLYIHNDITPETRDELEQRGYLVIVGWQYNHIVYILGWK